MEEVSFLHARFPTIEKVIKSMFIANTIFPREAGTQSGSPIAEERVDLNAYLRLLRSTTTSDFDIINFVIFLGA